MPEQTNSPISLGQLGYEAYATHTGWKSLATGQALPAWPELKPEIQQAWEATGLAYEAYFRKNNWNPAFGYDLCNEPNIR